ncbi:hypothetical protein B0A49_00133 [Cryomyces minteri]|uniref:Uncharacterized protein n=1 Tax=Cryomyces minteri TaxID=331657 RepID=A0A4U0Y0F9_9PEZI|nr:hypothetical protein B0A49_00133 [Cryomyces minteri]
MPAPLAKGIIIAASVLVAAGIAFYENPQVREWIEQSRRKIAMALNTLAEDSLPQTREEEAAAREATYNSPEAEERRRQGREYLARRNREMFEMRRRREENKQRGEATGGMLGSFDTLVNDDGSLREQHTVDTAVARDAEMTEGHEGIRRRGQGLRGLAAGAAFADPFDDMHEMQMDMEGARDLLGPMPDEVAAAVAAQQSRESTAMLPGSFHQVDQAPANETAANDDDAFFADLEKAMALSLAESASSSQGQQQQQQQQDLSPADVADDPDLAAAIAASLRSFSSEQARTQTVPNLPATDSSSLIDLSPTPATPRTPTIADDATHQPPLHPSLYTSVGEWAEHSARHLAPPGMLFYGQGADSIISAPDTAAHEHDYESTAVEMDGEAEGVRTPTSHAGRSRDEGFVTDDASSATASWSASLASALSEQRAAEQRGEPGEAVEVESVDSDDVSELGISTPGSWTEVESESDAEVGT